MNEQDFWRSSPGQPRISALWLSNARPARPTTPYRRLRLSRSDTSDVRTPAAGDNGGLRVCLTCDHGSASQETIDPRA
jgi:hypothetical protein